MTECMLFWERKPGRHRCKHIVDGRILGFVKRVRSNCWDGYICTGKPMGDKLVATSQSVYAARGVVAAAVLSSGSL